MLRRSLRTLFSQTPSRSLSPCSIFLTPSRSLSPFSILIAQCSTSSPPHFTYPHFHSDPEKVLVCWDLRKCSVPPEVNPYRVIHAIKAALKSSGIKGPISQITAFYDRKTLSNATHWALSYSSIDMIEARYVRSANVPLDKLLQNWSIEYPPPGYILLIGGSSSPLLPLLSTKGYKILFVTRESAPADICHAATMVWYWDALVRGENLTVRPGDLLRHELFSKKSFWSELKIFLNTAAGSFILAEARTRESLALCLQEFGHPDLKSKSVTKRDVCLMVHILIREKKWVQETAYLVNPFKVTKSGQIIPSDDAQASGGSI